MMHLLKPYPDELVGSVLHRATRQLGLSQKRLLPLLTGRSISSHSMVITSYEGIANACGMSLHEFLKQHTLLPYVTAFMSPQVRKRIEASLAGTSERSITVSSLSQNATKALMFLRFCPACVQEDMHLYGESYWKRIHQLPGVGICINHLAPLTSSPVEICRTNSLLTPQEIKRPYRSAGIDQHIATEIHHEIAKVSHLALTDGLTQSANWSTLYRKRAGELGYLLSSGDIYGEIVAHDLRSFYGKTYLGKIHCQINGQVKNSWPALMFRLSNQGATALKHILLNVFLNSSPMPSVIPASYEKRKKAKARDWPGIQQRAITMMNGIVSQHRRARSRTTLESLFKDARIEAVMRHHRKQVPLLVAWVESFKASPQSERQTGKRPRTYKKNR